MATPADQRLLELLDKWLASLELHLQYASLDDDAYRKVQPWIEHQRPNRWIVDLAKQRVLALKALLDEHIAAGDAKFSEALELTIFLANLVGSQHIDRFIPLAEPLSSAPAAPTAADSSTVTREMPKHLAAGPRARPERRSASRARPTTPPEAAKPAAAHKATGRVDPGRDQVLADAERLIQWGRKWYELPELIARMADRPPLAEVRRILAENKALVDRKIRRE